MKINEKEIFRHKTEHFVIEGLISELKGGKAIGLRGVSNEMVKNCPSSRFVPTLTRFFDCMINEQVLPIGFNVSILKPILKNVNKPNDDISNTRPVAISDAIQNLYERLLLWEINGVHKIAESYGLSHGMRFNPDKTELLVFNHNIKWTAAAQREDDWRGELQLNGRCIKSSSSIRYLGVFLSDNLKAKEHLKKRRSAMFLALARIS